MMDGVNPTRRKRRQLWAWLLTLIAGLLLITVGTQAQVAPEPSPVRENVILLPHRVIAETGQPVSLKKYHVNVSVQENVATTTIEQVFVNNTNRTLEAKYLFPLPEEAHFSNFTLTINGKAVEGEMMEKEKARNTYYGIVRKLIDPGLLEYIDHKTVQASIAPIFAHEEKTIRLSYSQLLRQDGGLTRYQYPFGFQAGQSIPTEDVSLALTLQTRAPLKTIYSPTHSPKIDRDGSRKAKVTVAGLQGSSEKNFVLYFSQDAGEIALNTLNYQKAGQDGYFLLALQAPQALEAQTRQAKNLMLVVDTSGSMSGDKIQQAKDALRYIIGQLKPDDRFNIVQFNTDVSSLFSGPVAANADHKRQAQEYVERLEANGSTNIEEALRQSMQQLPAERDGRPGYVIFLTDGQPTVGVTDVDGLLKVAAEANTRGASLFNFGVGYDLNTLLLGKLASAHHGSTTYVEPQENLENALTGFYKKIESPVLTGVKLDFGSLGVSKQYPAEVGDLFAGSEVIVLGRYSHGGAGTVTLTGQVNGQPRSFRYPVTWSAGTTHGYLPRLWAGRRIAYLLENIRQHGENSELKDEIIALSKQYGILTPYTSFLALEPEQKEGAAPPAPGQPVLLQSHRANFGGLTGTSAGAPMSASVGQGAVQLEKQLAKMKSQASAEAMADATAGEARLAIQTVGEKTFTLSKEGVWTDTAYDEGRHGKPQQLTFGTPEYFALLSAQPELSRYLSVGQSVLLEWQGRAYQIRPPKQG